MQLMLVGIGGLTGGLTRFQLGQVLSRRTGTAFPAATLLINITGAFLLGILTGSGVSGPLRLLLGDGFLGAYTTFSTFMYEGFHLFAGRKALNAAVYILGSLILGILGFILGYGIAQAFI